VKVYNSNIILSMEGKSLCTCIFMGLLTAALWAAPLVLLRLVLFTDGQYQTAFIAVCCWCIALNGITLIINFVDKCLACCDCSGKLTTRIPDRMLHFFTLLGGAPATVLAMIFFCHKSSKVAYHGSFLLISFFSIFFIGGAFALAYGLEWYMHKNVISTTIPFTESGSLTTFKTVTTSFADYQSTTTEDLTTIASNTSILVQNDTTTTGFMSTMMSSITARQNFSTQSNQSTLPFLSSTEFGSTSDELSTSQSVTFA